MEAGYAIYIFLFTTGKGGDMLHTRIYGISPAGRPAIALGLEVEGRSIDSMSTKVRHGARGADVQVLFLDRVLWYSVT